MESLPSKSFFESGRSAFTLVEILAALVVFSMIAVLLAQITSSTMAVMQRSRSRLEADQEARTVFDRLGCDLAAMVKNKEVDSIFSKQDGNDKMFFYSEVPGYFSSGSTGIQTQSPFSLVGYRINSDTNNPLAHCKLQRLGRGLSWSGSSSAGIMTFLALGSNSFEPLEESTLAGNSNLKTAIGAAPNFDGASSDYTVLSDGVYRFEFCFQLKDGTYSNKPVMNASGVKNNLSASLSPTQNDGAITGYSTGSRWYDNNAKRGYICIKASKTGAVWNPLGTGDISALVVAIAILDVNSHKKISDLQQAISAFSDPTDADLAANPPKLMASSWGDLRDQSLFAKVTRLNSDAASKIYIYQRYFTITP